MFAVSQPVSHRFLLIQELRHSNRYTQGTDGSQVRLINLQGKGRDRRTQGSVTQFRPLATWAWESHSARERSKTYTLSASHQYICFGTLSVPLWGENGSGVQCTTMRHVSDVFDRGRQCCCAWRIFRIIAGLGACTDQTPSCQKQSLQLHTRRVVSLMPPHASLSFWHFSW